MKAGSYIIKNGVFRNMTSITHILYDGDVILILSCNKKTSSATILHVNGCNFKYQLLLVSTICSVHRMMMNYKLCWFKCCHSIGYNSSVFYPCFLVIEQDNHWCIILTDKSKKLKVFTSLIENLVSQGTYERVV